MADDHKPDLNEPSESEEKAESQPGDPPEEKNELDSASDKSDDLKNLFKDEEPENKRKVAKTLLETEIPKVDDPEEKEEKSERIAKTLMESELPDLKKLKEIAEDVATAEVAAEKLDDLEEIKGEIEKIANTSEHDRTKTIAKTLMESDLPSLDRIKEEIEKQTAESDHDQDQESTVARTMLESDFPDLLRIHSLIAKKESQLELKKKQEETGSAEAKEEEEKEKSSSDEEPFELTPEPDDGKESRIHKAISDSLKPKIRNTKIILNRPLSRSFSMIRSDSTKKDVLLESQIGELDEPLSNQDNPDAPDALDELDSESEKAEEEGKQFLAELEQTPETKAIRKREEYVARTMLDHELILDSLSESIQRIEQKEKDEMEAKLASQPPKEEITNFKLAKACPWSWEDTGSEDKFRYCGQCENLVYNFDDCSPQEAEAIIFQRENKEKFQLYKREDGKFMTNDCPESDKKATRAVLMVVAGVTLLFLMVAAIALMPKPKSGIESATQKKAAPAPQPASDSQGTRKFVEGKEVPSRSTSPTATGSQTNQTGTVNSEKPDGSFYFDADDPNNNTPPPEVLKERIEGKDYSNVPEADPSGKQWKF